MTAVPFVHPWGNRLERWEYRVGRQHVDLRGLDLPTDPNGLPMHGNLRGAPFDVVRAGRRRTRRARSWPGSTTARAPTSSRAFPFPHVVTDRRPARRARAAPHHRDRADRPRARCRSRSAGTRSCRSRARRAATWELRWPRCERVLVDERVIPTGERVAAAGASARPSPTARSTITTRSAPTAASRCAPAAARVELRFGPTYPFAQLYVPDARQLRRDRADDRDDRRARPRHGARREARRPVPRLVHHRDATRSDPAPAAGRRAHRLPRQPLRSRRPLLGEPHAGRARGHGVSRARRLVAARGGGIGHVVCLTHDVAPYDAAPCTVTRVPAAGPRERRPAGAARPRTRARARGRRRRGRAHRATASASPCTAWAGAAAPEP